MKAEHLLAPPGAIAGREAFSGWLEFRPELLDHWAGNSFMLLSQTSIVPGTHEPIMLLDRGIFAKVIKQLEGERLGLFGVYPDPALAASDGSDDSMSGNIPVLAINHSTLADLELPAGYEAMPLRTALFGFPKPEHDLFKRVVQWSNWLIQTRYCERCGTPLERAEIELALACPVCQIAIYPRVAPCMITAIYRRASVDRPAQLLLAQNKMLKSRNLYSCVAGFVDPGESVETTVHREVREETGVLLESIRYIESEAWPFPHQLMIGFLSEYAEGEIVPEPGEIEDARWFDIDDLPQIPGTLTISGRLIRLAVQELSEDDQSESLTE